MSVSVLVCPCFYLPKSPAGREPAPTGTSACEDTSSPLSPRTEGGHCHCPSACLGAVPTQVVPSSFPTSLDPLESSRNNRMGLISWLPSQLRESGIGTGVNGNRGGGEC